VRATLALSANGSAWDEAPVKAKAYVQAETLLARSVSLSGSLTHHGRLTVRASARYGVWPHWKVSLLRSRLPRNVSLAAIPHSVQAADRPRLWGRPQDPAQSRSSSPAIPTRVSRAKSAPRHPVRRRGLADRTHRPVRCDPFSAGMGHDKPRPRQSPWSVRSRLVPAQRLADDIEPA
jgi:hypothetical protein